MQDHGIAPGSECRDDGGFQIVGRRDSGRLDFGLLRIFPIIVTHDEDVALVEIDRRIGQAVGQRDSIDGQRRSQPPKDHLFRIGAGDDETADEHVVAGPHVKTRRKIERQRRR